jgi:photosystem II stability/assembly factor-like uncharacterized protein
LIRIVQNRLLREGSSHTTQIYSIFAFSKDNTNFIFLLNSIKKNKNILVILLLLLYQNIPLAQGTWERLNSPTDKYLSSVYFVDSLYGWAVGDLGTIIHTTNGGTSWLLQNSNTDSLIIRDVFFLDRNLGWAVGVEVFSYPYGTYILKTTDGGTNWTKSMNPEENIFSQCILFVDSLNGWMGGRPNPNPIVRTTDGGISWTEAVIDSSTYSNFPVYDIKFYNSRFGYASGGHFDCCGVTWWTTNGGGNWSVVDTPYVAPEPIYQVHIYDSLNVLGVGGDFEPWGFGVGMYRTSSGGETWEFEYIGITGVAKDIDFRTKNEAWAPLGGEQKLMYSLDSGLTWTPVSTPDSAIIFKMIFPDSLHGFGVGMDGAIIKYKPEAVNNVYSQEELIPDGFVLQQNYPNPFNPNTKISYLIPEDCFVKLTVYNLLGEEVSLLVNEQQKSCSYEINFDAEQLSGGVYFYTLSASDFISSKKMVLLR